MLYELKELCQPFVHCQKISTDRQTEGWDLLKDHKDLGEMQSARREMYVK